MALPTNTTRHVNGKRKSQPFQLHRELTNLAVKLRRHLFNLCVLLLPMIRKNLGQLIQKPLVPLANLIGMNAIRLWP
jgi:iron-sulfur cluster repair protein YtfE (RIC family)